MKYIFLKPFGHKDSSDVCSFVQIHPYFFTIVSASIFLLTLADFACTFMIFKKMLLCRDGFGKNYVCHLILHDLGVSKKYILSVLEIFMVITFPVPCESWWSIYFLIYPNPCKCHINLKLKQIYTMYEYLVGYWQFIAMECHAGHR